MRIPLQQNQELNLPSSQGRGSQFGRNLIVQVSVPEVRRHEDESHVGACTRLRVDGNLEQQLEPVFIHPGTILRYNKGRIWHEKTRAHHAKRRRVHGHV